MRRTIGRQERDALHYITRGWLDDHLGIGTLLRANKVEAALNERRKVERLFALLDDLGWAADDPRESYALKMPDAELSSLMQEFRGEALDGLKRDAESDISECCEEDLDTVSACNFVLEVVA